MKKRGAAMALVLLAAVAAMPMVPVARSRLARERFISDWSLRLASIKKPDDLASISAEERPDLIWVKRFADGGWVVARSEHDCTDGAGFNAAVIADSEGTITEVRGYHFCGFEGLCGLSKVPGATADEFHGALTGFLAQGTFGDGTVASAPNHGTNEQIASKAEKP